MGCSGCMSSFTLECECVYLQSVMAEQFLKNLSEPELVPLYSFIDDTLAALNGRTKNCYKGYIREKLKHMMVDDPTENLVEVALCDATIKGNLHMRQLSSDKNVARAKQKWSQVYAILCGPTLYLYKERKEGQNFQMGKGCLKIDTEACLVDISYTDTKRKNVLKLGTRDSKYLFQAQNKDNMLAWIKALQQNSNINEELIAHKIQQQLLKKNQQQSKTILKETTGLDEEKGKKMMMVKWARKWLMSKEAPAVHSFGVKLDQCPPAHNNSLVPLIVQICCKLVEERGLNHTGIYRVPGNSSAISKLQEKVHKRAADICLQNEYLNVISSLLKSFFRSLPDPLLTDKKYSEFIGANRVVDSVERLNALKNLVLGLPAHHLKTLKFLIAHLKTVAQNSEKNKMDVKNLAIVFGPTLVRTSKESLDIMLTHMEDQQQIIETLIQEYDLFFAESNEAVMSL